MSNAKSSADNNKIYDNDNSIVQIINSSSEDEKLTYKPNRKKVSYISDDDEDIFENITVGLFIIILTLNHTIN